jgi:salicylate hydroxylase
MSICFVIIGGGIAGLACAFALGRVGHKVVVLEKATEADQDAVGSPVVSATY